LLNSDLFGSLCSLANRDDSATQFLLLVAKLLHEISRSTLVKPEILVKQILKLDKVVFDRLEQQITSSDGALDDILLLTWILFASLRARVSGSHENVISIITKILDYLYAPHEPQSELVAAALLRGGLVKPADLHFYMTSNMVSILGTLSCRQDHACHVRVLILEQLKKWLKQFQRIQLHQNGPLINEFMKSPSSGSQMGFRTRFSIFPSPIDLFFCFLSPRNLNLMLVCRGKMAFMRG
jgi:hypothetical protein